MVSGVGGGEGLGVMVPVLLRSSLEVEVTAGGVKGRPCRPPSVVSMTGGHQRTFGLRRRDLWALHWGGSGCAGEARDVFTISRPGMVRWPNGTVCPIGGPQREAWSQAITVGDWREKHDT